MEKLFQRIDLALDVSTFEKVKMEMEYNNSEGNQFVLFESRVNTTRDIG